MRPLLFPEQFTPRNIFLRAMRLKECIWAKKGVSTLSEGANLTYGSIGHSEAPGQIEVSVMRRALDQAENLHSQMEILAFLNQF